jgi:hypothetical protein
MPTQEDLPLVTAYYADSDGEEWPDAGSHESFIGTRTGIGSAPTLVSIDF